MGIAEAPQGRREKRKLETRTRIEDAAYELFRRQGIDDTSIEQICTEADVARRTFYSYFPNKHALLGGLGVSRLFSQSGPMLQVLIDNYSSTQARLRAMIDFIEATFASYEEIDRQLILAAPTVFANDPETQREINSSALDSFARLFAAGQAQGDARSTFSPEILAAMVVGTLNVLTVSWAMDSSYPIFAKLEEARHMFESIVCRD
ncbi:TetR/AcrR family transcriptional regulator [Haliea sp. E1-2-M8]|uniref:TetR/AcrR family transcriptional regulator n=1 Tax=Haliea sp. E1-2-M8 TaxID=3064706 RepID=UPI0027226A40|nr:TetR/AcrR family transcriptional regulator [Haliea sp. E1-2-M8]MDO8860290.1 TetR/AcrR family transcriptional regulator [Haliea sp. E1-2-M8]